MFSAPETLPGNPVSLQLILRAALAEFERLQLQLAASRRNRFDRRSEKLNDDQLQQGIEDLEQSIAEQEAGLESAVAADAPAPAPKPAVPSPATPPKRNRGALPAHLPRIELIVDVEDKTCPCCGGALHVIGEDRAEMLDYVPAQLRVKVIRRPRHGCRACEGAVVQAAAPERSIDGGMATEAPPAHVLINKYCVHLPLYGQTQIFARTGVTPDRSTLCNWVGRACWWLTPLHELMMSTVLASPKIFADDTVLPVLDPGRGKAKTGRLWCYAVDNRPWRGPGHPVAVYRYSEDRKGDHPADHLKGYAGLRQVDGYAGFAGLVTAPAAAPPKLVFCWAHARRKFHDIFVSTKAPLAKEALRRIAEPYKIEIDLRGKPAEERRRVRQLQIRPLVEALRVWFDETPPSVWPVHSGRGDPLRSASLGWIGAVFGGWPAGTGYQHRRPRDPAGHLVPEKFHVRGVGQRRTALGHYHVADPDREVEQCRATGVADRCAGTDCVRTNQTART